MLDFTEQVHSTTSPPELSLDTPIVSDSLPDTNPVHGGKMYDTLADPDTTAATRAALVPFMWEPGEKVIFIQDGDENAAVLD